MRKIKWVVEELEMQGKEIKLWNLAEIVGVKLGYVNVIYKEIEQSYMAKDMIGI